MPMDTHTATITDDDWRELTSVQRLPGLSAHGQAMLLRLRTHPAAPHFRDFSGHRLSPADLKRARQQHEWLRHAHVQSHAGDTAPPLWVWPWLWRHCGRVAQWPSWWQGWRGWSHLPTMSRADLQSNLRRHVPLHLQGPDLLCFSTSGTTGHPIRVPSTPLAAAAYQPLHERALALHGVALEAGRGDVGMVLAGHQQRCFTYVSVNPQRGECGLVKLNLFESEWRNPDDRACYLDDLQPELISGDPVSLSELARLDMQHRPKALLSTSMSLSLGLRERLALRFSCPVVDIYSMNEAGPLAVWLEAAQGHVWLQAGMHVEILSADGQPLPEGEWGEITVTGGINPCLPLLRYRTGDHARLVMTAWGPTLRDLQGRPPVRFKAACGRWVNNVELTQSLRHFDLQRFAIHQHADLSLHMRIATTTPNEAALHGQVRLALNTLLGPLPLQIEQLLAQDKVRQYTSELSA
jgi:phenylacetate-CoA ligase